MTINNCSFIKKNSFTKDLIYFAGKVPKPGSDDILPEIYLEKEYEEMLSIYLKKNKDEGSYIKGGAWFFPKVDSSIKKKKTLSAIDIWEILKKKIEISDVLVALLTPDAYGTITEAAYAGGKGDIAVYVFPTEGMSKEDIKELWFIFNLSLSTKHLWKESHFNHSPNIFPYRLTINEYEEMIVNIIPNFLNQD